MIVLVDFTDARRPHEIARFDYSPDDLHMARQVTLAYSTHDRLIKTYGADRYWPRWRDKKAEPLFEALDGQPTPDYRPIGS